MQRPSSWAPAADIVSRAKGVLTTAPCLELGDHMINLRPTKLYKGIVHEDDAMTTWLPRHRVPCALQRLPDGNTAVLLDDQVFYASPDAALARDCPRDVVFLAHYTEDCAPDNTAASRLLVFDVCLVDEGRLHPRERYNTLRGHLARFLPAPLGTVQWVGFRYAARGILERRAEYPHEIEGLLCLTPDCHRVVQPMELRLPHEFPPRK